MTVFVPLTLDAARQLRTVGSARDLVGYAAGPGLRTWLSEARLDDEEADYVALNHAGVAALTLDDTAPTRIVLAVDRDVADGDDLGAVTVAQLDWVAVRSLFADEGAAASAVLAARAAVRGSDLAAALSAPAVEALQESYDLLWYAPDELDALPAPT
ncbi:hypothetical protein GCM10022204_10070 [Microlunatus aurantiacus]|uniref:Uncharacterized protein n=1 Tax=Microlunatus aurantiacus TaxID=446786 RepID=A0ABP7CTV9_9ACTN